MFNLFLCFYWFVQFLRGGSTDRLRQLHLRRGEAGHYHYLSLGSNTTVRSWACFGLRVLRNFEISTKFGRIWTKFPKFQFDRVVTLSLNTFWLLLRKSLMSSSFFLSFLQKDQTLSVSPDKTTKSSVKHRRRINNENQYVWWWCCSSSQKECVFFEVACVFTCWLQVTTHGLRIHPFSSPFLSQPSGVNDRNDFAFIERALQCIQLSTESIASLWRVIAAIIHLVGCHDNVVRTWLRTALLSNFCGKPFQIGWTITRQRIWKEENPTVNLH